MNSRLRRRGSRWPIRDSFGGSALPRSELSFTLEDFSVVVAEFRCFRQVATRVKGMITEKEQAHVPSLENCCSSRRFSY